MNRRALFPAAFAIECPADYQSNALWIRYIEFLNQQLGDGYFSGDSVGDYYGARKAMDGLDRPVFTQFSLLSGETRVLSLPVFNDLMNTEIPSETTEEEVDEHEGMVLVDHPQSTFFNQWIPEDESRTADNRYGGLTFHEDEACYVYDDHCIMNEDLCDNNISWSDFNNQYVDEDDDDTSYGYYERSRRQGYFFSEERIYCNDEYYADCDVARWHGIVYDDRSGEYCHEDDLSPSCDVQSNNANYHDRNFPRVWLADDALFRVGFEVEKEDADVGEINYNELYNETKWIKESDSSLDDNTGYELVSPTLNLLDDTLEKHIQSSANLQLLINGKYSNKCGGHINLSASHYSPAQLFEGLSGFFPLLYSLYNGRINQRYCEAKKKHEYYRQDKYSAIFLKDNLVEFRIFSAVKNVQNLIWRRDLVRIMCEHINKSEVDVLKMMLNKNSKLFKHLAKVYNSEKIIDKIDKFVRFSNDFNNKLLPNPCTKHLKDIKTNSNDLGA